MTDFSQSINADESALKEFRLMIAWVITSLLITVIFVNLVHTLYGIAMNLYGFLKTLTLKCRKRTDTSKVVKMNPSESNTQKNLNNSQRENATVKTSVATEITINESLYNNDEI
jgi:hypothetical protein